MFYLFAVDVCGYPVRTECGNACGSQDLQTLYYKARTTPTNITRLNHAAAVLGLLDLVRRPDRGEPAALLRGSGLLRTAAAVPRHALLGLFSPLSAQV